MKGDKARQGLAPGPGAWKQLALTVNNHDVGAPGGSIGYVLNSRSHHRFGSQGGEFTPSMEPT